jgi:predicted DsbA family dithiol-disulfide isomerase
MRLEVWSDVICPWCYIGRRRLDKALAAYDHADEVEVVVVWRSFQLDPAFPKGAPQGTYEMLAGKMGCSLEQARSMTERVAALAAQEGLEYDFDRARVVNTFDAHRLTHLAHTRGLGGAMHERLMRANLIEGETLDDHETLVRLGAEVGLEDADARRVLAGDEYAADVDEDAREARALGVTGVPFFVLDRTYGVSGAQPVETFLETLRTAR